MDAPANSVTSCAGCVSLEEPEGNGNCRVCVSFDNFFDGASERVETKQVKETPDVVVEPSHYARWVIQPLKFIMANGFEFWRGNIVKYACRAGYKTYDGLTPEQSEVTDLKKVIQYAKVRIEELEGVS